MVAYQRIPPHNVNMITTEEVAQFPGSGIPPTLSITFDTPPPRPRREGDYNGNGLQAAADYVVWRKTLGQSGENLPADGDGNGSVGPEDYTVWRNAFVGHAGVRNGDFASGDLSQWETVVDTNTDVSIGFPRVEQFDVDGDGVANAAMRTRLGRIDALLEEGGRAGIEQEMVVSVAGDYVLTADFAAASFQDFGNTAPGRFELFFDDTLVDFVDLNGTVIEGFQVIRGDLEAQLPDVEAGYHTLRLMVHRPGTNSREIYGYFDNIWLTPFSGAAAAAVPEPAATILALVILGCGATVRGFRRRAV